MTAGSSQTSAAEFAAELIAAELVNAEVTDEKAEFAADLNSILHKTLEWNRTNE